MKVKSRPLIPRHSNVRGDLGHQGVCESFHSGGLLAGKRLGDAFPHLALYADFPITDEIETDVDLVMSALPTAASAEACAPFVRRGIPVIDIAADFRLKDPRA